MKLSEASEGVGEPVRSGMRYVEEASAFSKQDRFAF